MSHEKKALRHGRGQAIPFRQSLFWDVDPKTIDPKKHARYIVERIMDFGNDREAQWMFLTYPRLFLHAIAKKSRVLHPQSKVLWEALTRK